MKIIILKKKKIIITILIIMFLNFLAINPSAISVNPDIVKKINAII